MAHDLRLEERVDLVIDQPPALAEAHAGLGEAHRALGDRDLAREHYLKSLAIYGDLDLPDADLVRTRLAELGG